MSFQEEVDAFLGAHPDIEVVEVLLSDMNGILRIKQASPAVLKKIAKGAFTLPASVSYLSVTGDTLDCTLADLGSDPDRLCVAVPGTLQVVPWANRPTAQVLMTMRELDGSSWFTDPRCILEKTLSSYQSAGLKPVVAFEYEFYLLEKGAMPPRPVAPMSGMPRATGANYLTAEVHYDFAPILDEIEAACRVQGIPLDALLCEYGDGQFEVNLNHMDDALMASDYALLLKRVVKCVAFKHDMLASFMAKPLPDQSGNGLHLHMSILNASGDNIFGLDDGEEKLAAAVGGLLKAMPESTAIFAPTANSYRRFDPELYTPVVPNWGENNRRVSVRLPVADKTNRRFEHRVSGADACPHLVSAAILAAAHYGLTHNCDPGTKLGELDDIDMSNMLPSRWGRSNAVFKEGEILSDYLGERFVDLYGRIRSEEEEIYHRVISQTDLDWYLRVV